MIKCQENKNNQMISLKNVKNLNIAFNRYNSKLKIKKLVKSRLQYKFNQELFKKNKSNIKVNKLKFQQSLLVNHQHQVLYYYFVNTSMNIVWHSKQINLSIEL